MRFRDLQQALPALLVILSACGSCAPAGVDWRGHTLHEARSLADLPAVIRSRLGAGRPGLSGVADRGRPFNATDVVRDELPMRRFLAAGRDGDTWLVALERGGRGYRVEVFLFSEREAAPKEKWTLLGNPKTLAEVVQQVSRQEQGATKA
jgi:hypothetical protein